MRQTALPVPPRRLDQPGPADEPRVEAMPGGATAMDAVLAAGTSLLDALVAVLRPTGHPSAVLVLGEAEFSAFAYLLPAAAPDTTHAAWYSDTHVRSGPVRLERACATYGERGGAAFVHCHAVWVEADGTRRAGHLLPERCVLAGPLSLRAHLLHGIGFRALPDPETNFTLFQPVPMATPPATARSAQVAAVRIKPNVDPLAALGEVATRFGFHRAVLRGGLGSLVGAEFAGGGSVPDHATELLVTEGEVTAASPGSDDRGSPGGAEARMAILLADMRGEVHEGRLVPGRNGVCITFELLLEEAPD